jgi:uncharacterized membrane protein (UPF0182 family)
MPLLRARGRIGVGAMAEWVLFTNSGEFGIKTQFRRDVSYVFGLRSSSSSSTAVRRVGDRAAVTAVAHYLNGGIRFQSALQRVTPQVKAHLSVVLALMALVKTAGYYFFSRFV